MGKNDFSVFCYLYEALSIKRLLSCFHVSCTPNWASCHQKYSQSCAILWACYHGKSCHAFLGMICIQVIWKLLCHYLLSHMRIVLPGGCNFISVQISGYHWKICWSIHWKQRIELAKRCGWFRQSSASATATQKRVSRLYCTDARSSWTAWFTFRTKAVAMRKLQPGQSLLSAFICTCKMEGSGEMVSGCFTAIECCSCGLLQVLPLPVGDGHCWNKVKGHGRWRRDGRVSPNPGCRGRWKRSAPHELVFLYINPLFLSKQKQRKKRKTEEECNGSDPTPRTSPFSNGGIRNKQELFVVD